MDFIGTIVELIWIDENALQNLFLIHRLPKTERDKLLPQIPCQPIGYEDAKELLERLEGQRVPDAWVGGIDIDYVIGGAFKDCDDCYVK